MYAILYYNYYQFDNLGYCSIIGPYQTMAEAQIGLKKLVDKINDPLFKIGSDYDYARFAIEDLIAAERDEALASEIWAEIMELTPPQ